MQFIINLLAENQLLLLFTVIGLGYLLGNIKIGGFSLGVAAVLFSGIALGALDNRLSLPDTIYIIGLVLFVYTIGVQSGPGFFASFQKRGLRANLAVVLLLSAGAVVTVVLSKVMHVSAASAAGLFCGALTNTPALAATVETVTLLTKNLPAETANAFAGRPVIAYGLAYPFGVLGVIFWFYLFAKRFRVEPDGEKANCLQESGADLILSRTYRVTNPAVYGKTVEEILAHLPNSRFVVSRIKKGDQVEIVAPDDILSEGDQVVAVGDSEALETVRILFGEQSNENLVERQYDITYRRIFVSSKAAVGKAIRDLQLQKNLDATITRLRRGEVDFVPSPDTILELGDRIRVVTRRENLERVTKFFGDSIKALSETDFLSLSLGIVLGVFIGMIPFPLPNGMTFKLGFAGGPLIVGIILGRLERTGPINWGLPYNANIALRQIGLVFFLAGIGIKAGDGLVATFQTGGWKLFAAGAVITTFVTIGALVVGYKFLKLPMFAVMGMMSGLQTQPACLAYVNQQAESELPNVWYATVYPASMIAKILLAQIMVSALLRL
jgi:putative transport protein